MSGWPRLDYSADKGTIETLHLLLQLVGKRKRLLKYIAEKDGQAYLDLKKKLGIR